MRVLVTGATGRIGTHLTKQLLAAGYQVRALMLPNDSRGSALRDYGAEIMVGNIEDASFLNDAVRNTDAIVHLAASLPARGGTEREFFDMNLGGTFKLLCAARDVSPGLRRFVFASSDTVYSDPPDVPGFAFDENTPTRPMSIYGASKVAAEQFCLTFHRTYGLPVTILRFGGTLDAIELVTPGSVFARQLYIADTIAWLESLLEPTIEQRESIDMLRGLHNGDPRHLFIHCDLAGKPEVRHWGDARDIARGCILALETTEATGETFILAGPAPFTSDELVRHLASRTGDQFVTAKLPWSRPPFRFNLSKARTLLGYQPRYSVFDQIDEALGVDATGVS